MTDPESLEPSVSIVVPTFNGAPWLADQLRSLCDQRDAPPFEVVIADNGSGDGTLTIAAGFADRLRLRIVDASARRGQCYARNVGAAHSRGSVVLFLDQDDEVEARYVSAMARALESSSLAAARIDIGTLNASWKGLPRRVAQESGLAQGGPFAWGYGGTLGIRADVMAELGGFDSSLRDGAEDEDLCWRAAILGHPLVFVADAVVRYRLPSTAADLFRQGRRYGAAQVRLERVHHGLGCQSPTVRASAVLASKCGARLLMSRSSAERARWSFLVGRHLGMLETSMRRSPEPARRPAAVTPVSGIPAVVVHWREPGRCHSTVRSLMAQEGIGPVVVIDNESTLLDGAMPPGAEVVRVLPNPGYAGGANIGLARWLSTDAEFVLVTSHDCDLRVGGLRLLLQAARRHRDVGIIGPDHVIGVDAPDRATTPVADDDVIDVGFVSGTCALYRMACLREIGGFDAGLHSYCEDVDIAERARAAGWRVVIHREAVAVSKGSTSATSGLSIRINAVVVRRRHRGTRAATIEYGRTAWGLLRNLIGACTPGRAPVRRRDSSQRARQLARAVAHIRDVVIPRPSFHEIPAVRLADNAKGNSA
jgi:GT2 family glycosyltransferase